VAGAIEPGAKNILGSAKVNCQVFADIEIGVVDFLDPVREFFTFRRGVAEVLLSKNVLCLVNCGLGQPGINDQLRQIQSLTIGISQIDQGLDSSIAGDSRGLSYCRRPQKNRRADADFQHEQNDSDCE